LGIASNGQTIERKIKIIDSLSTSIDNNKELVEGITEGTIAKKRGKIIGGFSTYDLKDSGTGTIYRIRHEVSTDHYYKTTFYYSDKKVIKATIIIEDWKSDNSVDTIYSTTYYFDSFEVIENEGEDKKYSNSFDIRELAKNFQMNYTKRTP
jgi:hypothetical protein